MPTFYSPDHGGVYGNDVTKMNIAVTVTNEQFHPIISYAYMTSSRDFKVWDTLYRNILQKKSQRLKVLFWRCRGSNPGPHICETCALPLSYIPIPGSSSIKAYVNSERPSQHSETARVCIQPYEHIEFQVKFSVLIAFLAHLLHEKTIYFQSKEK